MNIKEEKELSCLNKNKMSNTLNQYRTLNKKTDIKLVFIVFQIHINKLSSLI